MNLLVENVAWQGWPHVPFTQSKEQYAGTFQPIRVADGDKREGTGSTDTPRHTANRQQSGRRMDRVHDGTHR
jgi:hypothetical protein